MYTGVTTEMPADDRAEWLADSLGNCGAVTYRNLMAKPGERRVA